MKRILCIFLLTVNYQLIGEPERFDRLEEGINSYNENFLEKSKKIFTSILSCDSRDELAQEASFYLSDIYYKQDSLEQALLAGYHSLEVSQSLADPKMIARSYMRIFQAQYKSQSYNRALTTVKKAIDASPDDTLKFRNYYNAGLTHIRLDHIDSAIFYFDGAFNYFQEIGDTLRACANLNQLGLSYYYLPDFDKSRWHYRHLLDYAMSINNTKYIGYSLNNIGNSYRKEGKLDSAIVYLDRAVPFRSKGSRMAIYMNLAELSEDPYPYLVAAKNSYTSTLDNRDYLNILQSLREYHSNPDSISYYTAQIADVSIAMNNMTQNVKSYSKYLAVENLEHQIALRELSKKKENERKALILWFCGGGLIFLILLGSILYTFKDRFIDKMTKFKINLMQYQIDEFRKTLAQFKKSL